MGTGTNQAFPGEISLPEGKYWGVQTELSRRNFKIGEERMPMELIYALALIKKAAAMANSELLPGRMTAKKCEAIAASCDEIIKGGHDFEFPLSVWQTGSGTQTNMNLNEVIANRGNELLKASLLHPNDDVNMSQSSNDVFPTAMHIAAVMSLENGLIPELESLIKTLKEKEKEQEGAIKCGRTHLQDAVPMSFPQELSGWRAALEADRERIINSLPGLCELAIGGTAVGTGLNAPEGFAERAVEIISDLCGREFQTSKNYFRALSSDSAVAFAHGTLRTLAGDLMKIAEDVRFLASGPRCGIGEISIPQNEPGSSIMPGKVNPTQCEALIMLCTRVMANDLAVAMAASGGRLQLNTMRPLSAYSFLQSTRLLADGMASFNQNCCRGIEANRAKMQENLHRSLMNSTALTPTLGYEAVAALVKKAERENLSLREACVAMGLMTAAEFDGIYRPEDMATDVRIKNDE